MTLLLQDKNVIVYGAGGPIGGAVARAFAREGAGVFKAAPNKVFGFDKGGLFSQTRWRF